MNFYQAIRKFFGLEDYNPVAHFDERDERYCHHGRMHKGDTFTANHRLVTCPRCLKNTPTVVLTEDD